MANDLLIKRARLRTGEQTDILIADGRFKRIAPMQDVEAAEVIDARGHLVTPPFCDAHLHLDAALSVGKPRYNRSGTLMEGIRVWGERKRALTVDTIIQNAVDVVKWEVANGSMFLRSHVDVTDPSDAALTALLAVREEVKPYADLQLVAFPQDCVFTSLDGPRRMERAMELGCDVVGGLPYFEYSPEDGIKQVQFVFDLAEKFGAMVDIHCDENTDEQSRYIERVAREAIVRGMEGRVTASHATAMHNYNNDYAAKVIETIRRAGMSIVTNPFANACLQNRTDGYPRHRGHTRVDELLLANVNVAAGSDDIMDPWYPMGYGSPLAAAGLLMNYAQLSGFDQLSDLFDMVTQNAAKLMMLSEYGVEAGKRASLVILDAESEFDAIRLTAAPLYVIRDGRVLCKTEPAKRLLTVSGGTEEIDFKLKDRNR